MQPCGYHSENEEEVNLVLTVSSSQIGVGVRAIVLLPRHTTPAGGLVDWDLCLSLFVSQSVYLDDYFELGFSLVPFAGGSP